MNENLLKEKNEEGEKVSPYWAGRRKQEQRDGLMKLYTDRYRVLTVELMIGLLNMPLNPSSRRIIETRYQRLVEGKYVRKIRKGYTTYYVSPSVIKKGDPQLEHKLMESYVWIALERALPVAKKEMSHQLRGQGGSIIPDGVFQINGTLYCLEIDTGLEQLAELKSKAQRYDKNRESLQDRYLMTNMQVLFITKYQSYVAEIFKELQDIGSGGMFLMTAQELFKPFDQSILTPIWFSPESPEQRTLKAE